MKELFVLLAGKMSMEMLVEKLQEDIAQFKEAQMLNKSDKELEDVFKAISFTSTIITIKESLIISGKSPEEYIKELNEGAKAMNFFKDAKNPGN